MPKSLAELTSDDLLEARRLASLFFTPREVATMLQVSVPAFIQQLEDEDTELYAAFWGGRLQSEVDLRQAVLKLAQAGSSPAQTMAMDLYRKSSVKMIDR